MLFSTNKVMKRVITLSRDIALLAGIIKQCYLLPFMVVILLKTKRAQLWI